MVQFQFFRVYNQSSQHHLLKGTLFSNYVLFWWSLTRVLILALLLANYVTLDNCGTSLWLRFLGFYFMYVCMTICIMYLCMYVCS